MNKYSEMSDFEINVTVINALYPNNHYQFSNYPSGSTICAWIGDGSGGQEYFDYTANLCQSMGLMIDNNISLICREFSNKVEWHASKNGISAFNVKPCRAIAECFLLIKDEERGNEKAQKEV